MRRWLLLLRSRKWGFGVAQFLGARVEIFLMSLIVLLLLRIFACNVSFWYWKYIEKITIQFYLLCFSISLSTGYPPCRHLRRNYIYGFDISLFLAWCNRTLSIALQYQEFFVDEVYKFDGNENRDSFFTPAEQSLLLYNLINKTPFKRVCVFQISWRFFRNCCNHTLKTKN